jgi:hypothetical protein
MDPKLNSGYDALEQSATRVNGGARPNSGPWPLHCRITNEQLEAACALIRTGRATVEAAIQSQITTTISSIDRSRKAGNEAAEKYENGGELSEEDQAALHWHSCLSSALAEAEIKLHRQAVGDEKIEIAKDPDGKPIYASNKHAEQALTVLRLSRRHWRPPVETKVEHSGKIETTDEASLQAQIAALEAELGLKT